MRQVASRINEALNERSECYQQSREKEHWMDRDTDADCESHQQSCRRWFHNCQQKFFHNATSFLHEKHSSNFVCDGNRQLALTGRKLRNQESGMACPVSASATTIAFARLVDSRPGNRQNAITSVCSVDYSINDSI